MIRPALYDWKLEQGALCELLVTFTDDAEAPIDTTGLLGRGQIRRHPGSPALVGTLAVGAVDHAAGQWKVTCLPAALVGYKFGPRKSAEDRVECHYDVELFDPGDPTRAFRVLQGRALVSVEVTT